MSKHLTKEKRAEYLINAVTKREVDIEVQKVEKGGDVVFKADDSSAGFFQSILSAPKRLIQYVYHAIVKPGKKKTVEEKQEVKEKEEEIKKELSEGIIELNISNIKTKQEKDIKTVINIKNESMLGEVFSKKMISEFSLKGFSSSGFGCVKKVSNSLSGFWAKRQVSNFELIQFALSNPKQIAKILLGRSTKIDSENDIEAEDLSEYARDIFSVTRQGKKVTSVFNVAAFKKMLLVHLKCNLSDHSPVISKIISGKYKGLYSINLEHLKVYIGKQVAELVFNPEVGKDKKAVLKPVMLPFIKSNEEGEEESESTDKIQVKLLLDVSGSMKGYMETYIKKVKNVVTKIIQSAENWQIDLTSFDSKSTSTSFNSDEHSLKSIIKFLGNLSSGGRTKLYGTMNEELTKMSKDNTKFTHSVFIVFTDGEDNESVYIGEEDVSSLALTVRKKVDNLQMFSMELGDSNKSFFKKIGVESGFTHIQLGEIEDVGKFEQYVSGLLKNTVVLKLFNESLKVWARQVAVEGEITVGNVVVKPNTLLKFGDVTYTISNPTEDFSDLLGDNGSLENSE